MLETPQLQVQRNVLKN